MKKMLNKVCNFALASFMAMAAIIPTTSAYGGVILAEDETYKISISLPEDKLTTTSIVEDGKEVQSGDLEQTVKGLAGDDSGFKTIIMKPKKGYAFTNIDAVKSALNKVIGDAGPYVNFDKQTSGYDGILKIGTFFDLTFKRDVTVTKDVFESVMQESYIMYGGVSAANASGDENKMDAQYDSTTGMLTFKGYPYSDKANVLECYANADSDAFYKYEVTRFYVKVYKGSSTSASTDSAAILTFNLGSGTAGEKVTPDTTYATDNVVTPSINAKKIIEDYSTSLTDDDYLWVQVCTISGNSPAPDAYDRSFFINAGKVSDIKGSSTETRTVTIVPGDYVTWDNTSGALTQTLDGTTSFTNIVLETEPGYAFTDSTITKLNETLEAKGLMAEKNSSYKLTIKAKTTSDDIQTVSVAVDASTLTKQYVMYNDKFSKVGQTGENNKMNAKYDVASGKLTFDCTTTGGLDYYDENSDLSRYTGFSRFYVTVYSTDENGSIEDGTKLVEFNLGKGSGDAKADTNYASESTTDPYINLKKVIEEKGTKLSSSSLVWVKVRACSNTSMIDEGNVFFKIRVGTVAEITGKKVDPTPTPTPTASSSTKKSSGGWDDGGPFTTDTCGNVFDRWGNKIYEAKACNVGGYNLVRTSVED